MGAMPASEVYRCYPILTLYLDTYVMFAPAAMMRSKYLLLLIDKEVKGPLRA